MVLWPTVEAVEKRISAVLEQSDLYVSELAMWLYTYTLDYTAITAGVVDTHQVGVLFVYYQYRLYGAIWTGQVNIQTSQLG